MSFTYADALTYVNYLDRQANSTMNLSLQQRIVNDSNRDFHCYNGRLFDFDRQYIQVPLYEAYQPATTDATVTVTVGSSTLTGSGTAFTAAMVGRLARINGQYEQYYITAYTSATQVTIQPYLGSTDGYIGPTISGSASIAVTYDNILLPANFRTIDRVQQNFTPIELDGSYTRDDIWRLRQYERQVSYPRMFATDTMKNLTDSTQRDYLMIYPPCSAKRVAKIFYYAYPTECTSDTDQFGVNNYSLPYEAESVLRAFIKARMLQYQGDPSWQAAFTEANELADNLQGDRSNSFGMQKQMWSPAGDACGYGSIYNPLPFGNILSPNSPGYTGG